MVNALDVIAVAVALGASCFALVLFGRLLWVLGGDFVQRAKARRSWKVRRVTPLEVRVEHHHTRRCPEGCEGVNLREIQKVLYDVIEDTLRS